MPNVLGPRDLVFRPDNMDETIPHTTQLIFKFITLVDFKMPTIVDTLILMSQVNYWLR